MIRLRKPSSSFRAALPTICANRSAHAIARRRSSLPEARTFPDGAGRVEWAVGWPLWSEGSYSWYCNTIPTPDGGTHEAGLRAAIVKGIRAFGALVGQQEGGADYGG
jgi:DNA gyrase/topoisomerase IV subunit B